jgi:hypothetical protein
LGRWPFPVDVSADQLPHASSSRRPTRARSRRVSFEDSLGLSRPFLTRVTEMTFASRLPLLVSSKNASPPTCALCVHSRLPGAKELPHSPARSALAVSHDSEVCSTLSVAGLLHPATDHEVRLVSSRSPTLPPGCRPSSQALVPFEAFPSAAVDLPVSRAPSLSPLAPRVPKYRHAATTGLCSTAESVARCRRCHQLRARCSLGLSPTPGSRQAPRDRSQLASPPPKQRSAHHRSGHSARQPSRAPLLPEVP